MASPRRTPFTARLEQGRLEGDPPADRLVEAFRGLPGGAGWRMLDEALAGGVPAGAPPELAALLDPHRDPPSWLDPDLVDEGAVAFWRVGSPALFLALTYGSLAFGYQSAALVRPLAATGRLERMAPRRLAETMRWAVAVTAPGGLRVDSRGWRSTVRVRMVHALVRDHLRRSGEWAPEWGMPISAADGFATAIGGFYVIPCRSLADLGVRFSRREDRAVGHLWRWVGHLMGVPDDLLPETPEQARAWVDEAVALDAGPTEDSPRLMRALLYHGLKLEDGLPGVVAGPVRVAGAHVMGGFARRWLGEDMADRLEVPGAPLSRLVPLLRHAAWARDAVRATGVLGSDERIAQAELAMARWVLSARGARGPLRPDRLAA